ncbi:MAG: PAS domain S-box protein [Treponema sp.]|jgi:PAS domain S-box-containing protein|nr:PAS domain S-box protein [Treponema sp.]
MRDFYKRALKKLNKLTDEQSKTLLVAAAAEVDRLETVMDSLADGILVCDTKYNLVMVNKYAERFLPMGSSEPGNGPLWQMVRDERIADFLERTLSGGDRVEEREFDIEVKDINRLLSISVLPLVQEHQVTGSLIYIEDITEKRGREARLRRAENLASLTTLAAGVAHEIKNPLGSISIHIQLMKKAIDKNRELFVNAHPGGTDSIGQEPVPYFDLLDKYIAVVNEEVDRLNHIVVDFLFAVRPMDMELREGDINALITELVEFVWYELEQNHIECVLELEKDIPLILFDERYMKQALLNLIKNAQSAMPEGGSLKIKTEKTDMNILVNVFDTGVGISEENLSKIFEPFFTTRETGSGLGLTLVFKIIREHEGEISVKSRMGAGTCFTITLPMPQKDRRLITYGGTGPVGDAAPDAEAGGRR